MHIGVCYRDLPLRPAYCRNPLVSRSRQVMSFLFWGGSMVLRQMFQIGRWKLFIAHVFLVFRWRKEACLRSRVLRRRVVLFVTAVRCFLNVQFSVVAWYLCATIVTHDVCAIDVFDNINIYRHYCKESTCNSRNMPDDNELRAFFAMSEAILNTEEIRFQWSKRTLLRQKNMDAYWRYSVIVNFISGGTWIVCSSSLRAPMMFLFRWAKWTAVSQLITPVQAFQFDNSSFLYASFSTLNWAQCCTTFLLKKWLSTGQRQTEVPFA